MLNTSNAPLAARRLYDIRKQVLANPFRIKGGEEIFRPTAQGGVTVLQDTEMKITGETGFGEETILLHAGSSIGYESAHDRVSFSTEGPKVATSAPKQRQALFTMPADPATKEMFWNPEGIHPTGETVADRDVFRLNYQSPDLAEGPRGQHLIIGTPTRLEVYTIDGEGATAEAFNTKNWKKAPAHQFGPAELKTLHIAYFRVDSSAVPAEPGGDRTMQADHAMMTRKGEPILTVRGGSTLSATGHHEIETERPVEPSSKYLQGPLTMHETFDITPGRGKRTTVEHAALVMNERGQLVDGSMTQGTLLPDQGQFKLA